MRNSIKFFLKNYLSWALSLHDLALTQHFKLVFGDWFPLFSFNLIPAVRGQIPKLPTLETFSPLSFF